MSTTGPSDVKIAGSEKTRFRIHTHITQTRWLHVEDALSIGKLRLFSGQYRRGDGASQTAYHFIDLGDARVLFFDLSLGRVPDFGKTGAGYVEYKGSGDGENAVSRVLRVKKGQDGRVWFEMRSGPGQVTPTGAVKPAGDPTTTVTVGLTPYEARRLGFAVGSYLSVRERGYWQARWKRVRGAGR
jgi:hypothetical protein